MIQDIDLKSNDKSGMTALMQACAYGMKDVLLDHPDQDIDWYARNNQDLTAINLAGTNGHQEIVQLYSHNIRSTST